MCQRNDPTTQGTLLWLPLAAPAAPAQPLTAPGPWLSLSLSDPVTVTELISLISPSPQVQHKSGLWERKFQIPFSAFACPQLSVSIVVILANEKKRDQRGGKRCQCDHQHMVLFCKVMEVILAIPLPLSRSLG